MWWNFLLGITGPIVVRVLATLGIGIVTYTGLTAIVQTVYQQIQLSFNSLPSDIAALVFLSGLPQGISIMLSALAARIAMTQVSKIQRL
jgi:hypothetical protein